MRAILTSVVTVICIVAPQAIWPQANPHDYDPLLWSPMVVRGVVEEVGPQYFTHEQLFPNGPEMPENPPGSRYYVDSIELKVIEVIKGRCAEPVFRAWNLKSDYQRLLRPGQEIVVCAQPSPLFGGAYVVNEPNDIYAKDGDVWVRGIVQQATPQGSIPGFSRMPEPLPNLTYVEIVERAKRASVLSITRESDLIVVGEVVAVGKRLLDGAEVNTISMQVDRVLKGNGASTVSFLMRQSIAGIEYGTLNSYIPMLPSVGQKWLVYLRQSSNGYFPFAGANGLLRVQGDKLIYGPIGGPYPYSAREMEDLVKMEVNEHD